MFYKLFLLAILIFIVSGQETPLCVWYRSAPFCGEGVDCPAGYTIKLDQCGKSDAAAYCQPEFGHNCWSGSKLLCCNADVPNPKNTSSYTCGDYGFRDKSQ
uniref:Uncharacterized protein n=1 Tax=Acrobeloides nanus TaxID=290746 RepID=A0A914E4K3_9BILA